MSATFNVSLATDLDWVRALIGDTDTATAALDDATITAILAEEPNKWYAAARCGEIAFARWQIAASGALEKAVGSLRLRYDTRANAYKAYKDHLYGLRVEGARALTTDGRSFLFRSI